MHVNPDSKHLACCRVRQFLHLVWDAIVALLMVLMHGTVIMSQGMAFDVGKAQSRSVPDACQV